jgi:hypothetical protein
VRNAPLPDNPGLDDDGSSWAPAWNADASL